MKYARDVYRAAKLIFIQAYNAIARIFKAKSVFYWVYDYYELFNYTSHG